MRWKLLPAILLLGAATTGADVAVMDRAKEVLRLGTVRIRTARGTDFMFRTGMRPYHIAEGKNGGRLLRVAPVEQASFGQISLPEVRFGEVAGKNVVLEVDNGRITRFRAAEGAAALTEALDARGEAARRFAEFSLGFSEEVSEGPAAAGTVCLAFGGNEELGGALPGPAEQRYCLPDASVHVDFRYLVREGRLVP